MSDCLTAFDELPNLFQIRILQILGKENMVEGYKDMPTKHIGFEISSKEVDPGFFDEDIVLLLVEDLCVRVREKYEDDFVFFHPCVTFHRETVTVIIKFALKEREEEQDVENEDD